MTPQVTRTGRTRHLAGRYPPETGGSTATSSVAATAVDRSAGSPFTHTLQCGRIRASGAPKRASAASSTAPTVAPSTSADFVPTASRACAKNSSVATGARYRQPSLVGATSRWPTVRKLFVTMAAAWFTLRMTHAPDAPLLAHGVLAIRHGLTQWNADSRWQGWADVPLSDTGLAQADEAALALARLVGPRAPVHIVASDLQRARHTAERLAAALGVDQVEIRSDLRERDVGDWSGLTTDQIEARWPGLLDRWRVGAMQTTPSGEHEDVLRRRITGAIDELARKAAAEDAIVVAVTHGGVIRTLDRLYGAVPQPVANVAGRWFHWTGDEVELGTTVELLGPDAQTLPKGASL